MRLIEQLRQGRVGFRIEESMSGTHEFEPGQGPEGRHPFFFKVTWGGADITWREQWRRNRSLKVELKGKVTAGGLCAEAPCEGTLDLRYFKDGSIRYTFFFETGGKRYRYMGEKVHIRPWNLPFSHTTCYGILTETDTGRLVSRSVTHFRFRTMPAFLASFRLV